MKWCPDCGEMRPASDFNKRTARADGLQPICRTHQRERYRAYYQNDGGRERSRLVTKNRAELAAKRQMLAEMKAVPCADCGVSYPSYVMDFDHLSDDKDGDISSMVVRWGWDRLRAEVAKCEVVCANCHRIRTHERRLRVEDSNLDSRVQSAESCL